MGTVPSSRKSFPIPEIGATSSKLTSTTSTDEPGEQPTGEDFCTFANTGKEFNVENFSRTHKINNITLLAFYQFLLDITNSLFTSAGEGVPDDPRRVPGLLKTELLF